MKAQADLFSQSADGDEALDGDVCFPFSECEFPVACTISTIVYCRYFSIWGSADADTSMVLERFLEEGAPGAGQIWLEDVARWPRDVRGLKLSILRPSRVF